MRHAKVLSGLALVTALASAPVMAADAQPLKGLADCRAIADPTARLACFDREAAALTTAVAADRVVVVDRAEVRRARKGLFGFSMPRIPFLTGRAGNKEDEADENELTSTIRSASRDANGNWSFVLADGARWRQNGDYLYRAPKPNAPIRIRKAALGSYLANVDGAPSIRVTRER